MTIAYTFFAECHDLGGDYYHLGQFMDLLKKAVVENETVIMADRHIVACPNFRRAFRSDTYGRYLREQFTNGKIRIAMFDGQWMDDGSIKHFTLHRFQEWFNHCQLWTNQCPAWDYIGTQVFKAMDPVTKAELEFFDSDQTQKIFTRSRNRDPDFRDALLSDVDNPILKRNLGAYHPAFAAFAYDFYDHRKSSLGIICVTPFDDGAEPNIHAGFSHYLKEREVPTHHAASMLSTVCNFGHATMAHIVLGIVGSNVTPILSPVQNAGWSDLMANAIWNRSAPPSPGKAQLQRNKGPL
jgi:hypothetical protein